MPRDLFPPLPKSGNRSRPTPAFTIIELLVVISIIGLVAAIGVAVSGAVLRGAEANRVRTLLGQIAGAMTEYREQVGRHVNLAIGMNTYEDSDPYDPSEDYESINLFVRAIEQNSRPAFEQLQTVNERFIAGGNFEAPLQTMPIPTDNQKRNGESIIDSFDNPLRYYPGSDNGGMDQTANGLPLRKQPYIASAGKDGLWGRIDPMTNEPVAMGTNADQDNDGVADAEDNLYSFEVQ